MEKLNSENYLMKISNFNSLVSTTKIIFTTT